MSTGILHNIRVLDFTWVLAGPYATRMLADFAAEVIKIQPLLPAMEDSFSQAYYNTWNRNKLGITLNLNKPDGIAIAKRLVSISDAVVENFSPRVMVNWGLDYKNLTKLKPGIIMVSLSTMGHTGSWCDFSGFGPTVQAFSGMTYLTSFPGKPPAGLGFSYANHVAALNAVLAMLGALEYRRKTGKGQYIDISELESMCGLLGESIMEYSMTHVEPEPSGNRSKNASPHNVYPCLGDDRWCAIAVHNDEQWLGFKRALGSPSWADSAEYDHLVGRLSHSEELDRRISDWTRRHEADEVMRLLQTEGVPAGIVQDARDLARDPQLKSRGFFVKLEHPEVGLTMSDASPIKLSGSPAAYHRAAPVSGQDNDYVYRLLLGMDETEISGLREKGVI